MESQLEELIAECEKARGSITIADDLKQLEYLTGILKRMQDQSCAYPFHPDVSVSFYAFVDVVRQELAGWIGRSECGRTRITDLDLPIRIVNHLRARPRILYVDQLLRLDASQIDEIRGIGLDSIVKIIEALEKYGHEVPQDWKKYVT